MENTSDKQEINVNSYCSERLKMYKISEEQNKIQVHEIDYPVQSIPIFYPDDNDNIKIKYISPEGKILKYESNGKLKDFERIRYKNPNGKGKYNQPYKSGVFPFIPPAIIQKFRAEDKIKTLFVTEGEFKSFVMSINGFDSVGIGGIQNYIDKHKNDLDQYLKQIIEVCSVENIVLLFDADCLTVKYEPEKDLYKRPNSFYTAVKNFKEFTKPLNVDVYFSHLLPAFENVAKGIDDLIINDNTNLEILRQELNNFSVGNDRKYIFTINISENSISKLREYFGINNVNKFYEKYSHIIQENEFFYFRSKYQYINDELKLIKHGDADLFIRIGVDYFKHVAVINAKNGYEIVLKKWQIGEITRDYVNNGVKDMFNQIQKYDAFCNIPNNTEDYKRVYSINFDDGKISKNYNLYEPFTIEGKEGSLDNTLKYLLHLTGNENVNYELKLGDKFTILLDYLTILFQKPTHILPVLVLVSEEQQTGKTTLFDLLKEIYKTNAVILSDDEFKMSFNAHYSTKFLLMVDESSTDKKRDKERIKKLATSKKIFVQYKGADLFEIDYYGKLMIAGNDENDLLPLVKEDVRFFVLKVPILNIVDAYFIDKLINEIPAFIHFLKHRTIFHPKESRAWFKDKYIITEQALKIIEYTKPIIEKDIEECVKNYFEDYQVNEFNCDIETLTELINSKAKYKHATQEIRKKLKDRYKLEPIEKPMKFQIYTGFINDSYGDEVAPIIKRKTGRYYIFNRATFGLKEIDVGDKMPF